jgi:hypothetical protein
LFLRETIKYSSKPHSDNANLVEALLKVETVVAIVNEGARKAEILQKMLDLQGKFSPKLSIFIPSRVLIKNSPIDHLNSSNDRKKRELYLFNDMVLLVKAMDSKLKSIAMVPFESILVNSLPDTFGKENCFEIVHIGSTKFTLVCDSAYSKEQWLKSLTSTVESWMNKILRTTSNGNLRASAEGLNNPLPGSNLTSGRNLIGNLDGGEMLNKNGIRGSGASLEEPRLTKQMKMLQPEDSFSPKPPSGARPEYRSSPRLERTHGENASPPVEEKSLGSIKTNPFVMSDKPASTSNRSRYHSEISASGNNLSTVKTHAAVLQSSLEGLNKSQFRIEHNTSAKSLNAKVGSNAGIYQAPTRNKNDLHNIKSRPKRPAMAATIFTVARNPDTAEARKCYLYVIQVKYSGGENETIERSYDDFFDMHLQIIGNFPLEAGVSICGEIQPRIIPDLPGQLMYVSGKAARERIPLLQEYIEVLRTQLT